MGRWLWIAELGLTITTGLNILRKLLVLIIFRCLIGFQVYDVSPKWSCTFSVMSLQCSCTFPVIPLFTYRAFVGCTGISFPASASALLAPFHTIVPILFIRELWSGTVFINCLTFFSSCCVLLYFVWLVVVVHHVTKSMAAAISIVLLYSSLFYSFVELIVTMPSLSPVAMLSTFHAEMDVVDVLWMELCATLVDALRMYAQSCSLCACTLCSLNSLRSYIYLWYNLHCSEAILYIVLRRIISNWNFPMVQRGAYGVCLAFASDTWRAAVLVIASPMYCLRMFYTTSRCSVFWHLSGEAVIRWQV